MILFAGVGESQPRRAESWFREEPGDMVDLAVLGLYLDSMILKVFSNLSDSMILYSTVPVVKSSGKHFCKMSPGPPQLLAGSVANGSYVVALIWCPHT